MSKKDKDLLPSKEKVDKIVMLTSFLDSTLDEMREFAKKKPEGILNKFKVNMINKRLNDIKLLLVDEPTKDYLDILDEETLPQNSDTVLILGQYDKALKQFKKKYFESDHTFGSDQGTWKTRD